MSELVLEIDERTIENLMVGPHVFIEASNTRYAKKIAYFNKAAFRKYAHLIDEHGCDGFSIEIEDIAEDKLQEYFMPDFSAIRKKDAITQIGIVGSGAFAEDFDLDGFKEFENVKALVTHDVSFGERLPDLFPKLEAWLNLDWRANRIKAAEGKWQTLERLSVQGFSGPMSALRGLSLKRLFLIASTVKTIEEIVQFEDLELLQIQACRIAGDVSVLSQLKRLRSLRVEGKNKLEGWENLTSATIENLELSHYPVKNPLRHFPKLENYVVNAYRERDPNYEEGGDFALLNHEFSGIFG